MDDVLRFAESVAAQPAGGGSDGAIHLQAAIKESVRDAAASDALCWLAGAVGAAADAAAGAGDPSARASRSGFDAAILDAACRVAKLPLWRLLDAMRRSMGLHGADGEAGPPAGRRSFFTIGITSDMEELRSSVRFGRRATPLLKVKVAADVEQAVALVKQVVAESVRDAGDAPAFDDGDRACPPDPAASAVR